MALNKILYSDIRDKLREANIFFKVDGSERHKPSDILQIMSDVAIEPYCAFLGGSNLISMGSFSYSWSTLSHEMSVGRYCSIASGLSIMGTRHPYEWISTSSFTYDKNFVIFNKSLEDFSANYTVHKTPATNNKIVIGNDVWIGANVLLSRGITINDGAVIAANSVVTKDVEPYTVVGGVPAKVIKKRFSDDVICALRMLQWWDYKFSDFNNLDIKNPMKFVVKLRNLVEKGSIIPYKPTTFGIEE
ncbi:MAG: CatB-related O-acetyltransferase [Campylobacteraceae bacterium]|jgi:acetyltransferase-like isoleucine patch superfamily enzyme|nr:CatB-related O-acetyltransferase [Campylobacteraceae bacterium]